MSTPAARARVAMVTALASGPEAPKGEGAWAPGPLHSSQPLLPPDPQGVCTPSSVPYLQEGSPRALGRGPTQALEAGIRLWGQGILGYGHPECGLGEESGGPIISVMLWAMEGAPLCFYWSPHGCFARGPASPGKGTSRLEGVPGVSSQSGASREQAAAPCFSPHGLESVAQGEASCPSSAPSSPAWGPILQVKKLKVGIKYLAPGW